MYKHIYKRILKHSQLNQVEVQGNFAFGIQPYPMPKGKAYSIAAM
jgi:hypothetical protein